MALRNIRTKGDDILYKKCKEVKSFDKKLGILLDDMYETMQKNEGVGIAASQVGILKRAYVVDIGEGKTEFINPVIVSSEGSQTGQEGCLSVPGEVGNVERPKKVTVKAFDRDGNEFELTAEDLFARAICHELDHLDGILFLDKVIPE